MFNRLHCVYGSKDQNTNTITPPSVFTLGSTDYFEFSNNCSTGRVEGEMLQLIGKWFVLKMPVHDHK